MHYVVSCIDKVGLLPVRQANRAAHLEYVKANADTILVGGPYLDDAGNMIGSVLRSGVAREIVRGLFGNARRR